MEEEMEILEELQQIWSSDLIAMFGLWLIENKEYGHGLLCIHGPSFGMKIGDQLKLQWKHIMRIGGGVGHTLNYNDGKESSRLLSDFVEDITRKVYSKLKISGKNDLNLYVNTRTGKPLTTSTLNRELAKFAKEFLEDIHNKTGIWLLMKELKSNAFEIAWGRDMVMKYMLTKKVFQAVNRYMGHRQMSDTYELLELWPNDEIKFRFDIYSPSYDYESFGVVLNDKRKLKKALSELKLRRFGGDEKILPEIE